MPNGPEVKQRDRELRISSARRKKLLKRTLGIGIVIALVAAGSWWLVRYTREQSQNQPGAFYPDQGRPHVPIGTPFAYNSNPPTSGPHFAQPAEWGVYREEIPDQVLIHNLEHGGIWISYRSGIATSTVERLEAVAREFGRKVIMAPRSANDADIALAAWNRLDKFSADEFSEERVRSFIKAWRNKGPEFVP